MKRYIDIMANILEANQEKVATRKEDHEPMPTIGLANQHFSHNLQNGFPLLTTRRIHYKQTFGELRAFLEGKDTQEGFAQSGCTFWDQWAFDDGSLGPIYGVQWNRHSQMEHVLDCLRNRPTDRRMVVSAWRPDEHHQMCLPPCHLMWVVTPYGGKLNLSWIQRSCDWPVGVPHNIASYALLSHLLARWARLEPGTIDCIFCDAHVYKNQIDFARSQCIRSPKTLPTLCLRSSPTDFHDWEADVQGYVYHPAIKYEVTV